MRFRHLLFWHLALLSFWPTSGLFAANETAQQESSEDCSSCGEGVHPGDAVWMISTRHLGCPNWKNPDNPDYQVMCRDPADGWQQSTWNAWQNSEAWQGLTIVYIHGNRIDWDKAFHRGMSAYRALRCHSWSDEPIRFVIWSWPSDRIRGALRDVRAKANRADVEGYYFARFLSQISSGHRVGVMGYSYGARIASGGLHLIAGGSLCGHHLPIAPSPPGCTTRTTLLAAALHNYWWLPGCRHDHCLSQVDHMLLLYNPNDPVLRWYSKVERRSRPQALGRTGLCCPERLGEDGTRLEQYSVACEIGKTHDVEAYFASTAIMQAIADSLLWQLEPMAESVAVDEYDQAPAFP